MTTEFLQFVHKNGQPCMVRVSAIRGTWPAGSDDDGKTCIMLDGTNDAHGHIVIVDHKPGHVARMIRESGARMVREESKR